MHLRRPHLILSQLLEFFEDDSIRITQENPDTKLLVVPNPATEFLFLEFSSADHGFERLDLYDRTGRMVKWEDLDPAKQVCFLDISHLPTGSFILRIHSSSASLTRQIIVMN